MSISIYDPQEDFLGAGNLAVYTFDFLITDPSQLLVIVADNTGLEIVRVRGTDTTYLSNLVFDPINGGGTVYLQSVLPSAYRLLLLQANDTPAQPFQFSDKFSFNLPTITRALDNLGSALQRAVFKGSKAITISELDDIPGSFNPAFPAGLPGVIQGIPTTNLTGTGWDLPQHWITRPNIQAAVDAATAAAVSAANSAASAGNSAASATAATGSNAAAIAAANAAAASATTAGNAATTATNASNTATTAATNAGNSATTATNAATAAGTSATNASASATSANTSATNAGTSATNSANSATAAAASAAAAAASAGSSPDVEGSKASPVAITAAGGIAFNKPNWMNIWFIIGSGGPATISRNPQIAAGQVVGQILRLIGQDNTNTVTFDGTSTGMSIKGAWVGEQDRVIEFTWDGSNWVESFRS